MRIGMGYDVHRLVEGRKCIIGGVEIPYEKGLLGHSDADVLIHAVMDALLGLDGVRRYRKTLSGYGSGLRGDFVHKAVGACGGTFGRKFIPDREY